MDQLDDAAWRNLVLLESKVIRLDYRYARDRARIPGFMALYERGYYALKETGPGDSVHIFTITPAGREALAAGRGYT